MLERVREEEDLSDEVLTALRAQQEGALSSDEMREQLPDPEVPGARTASCSFVSERHASISVRVAHRS